ncbi:MAG: pyridoxamine 5'-phosphate oxidase family protein [Oscillospiraceae bacterium]|jgi:general stress protein 26|nr:pyridoxamine 5'-phosphate oxidase family protein [Oscillospiraceae bacterium]
MMKNPEQAIGRLIDKQSVALIAAVDEHGFPTVKAMLAPRKREGIRRFLFSTNTSSRRVAQYRANPKASIYFYDKRLFRGVMLTGTMEVLEDAESKKSLWKITDLQYYHKGVTDPDYCVLRFTAQSGRFYRNFQSEDFAVVD